MRTLLFALAASCACFGQVQILLLDAPGSERPAAAVHSIGSAPVGERLDTVFRVRNTAQTALVIRTLTVAGTGFSMFGQPSLPHTLAPGLNVDFTVRFSPRDFGSYSANLTVNGTGLLLTGSSTAAPVLSVDGVLLSSGSSVDLGLAERGTVSTKSLRLENTTSERVVVQTATVTGKPFRLGPGLPLPLKLPPRAAVHFDVAFSPTASGVFEGSLVLDGRAYRLTAAAHEPPFPKPAILIDLPNPSSGQQGRVSVRFGEASRAIGTGKVRMEFRPSTVLSSDDEAVRFVRGARATTFEVAEGSTIPLSELTFQTGTTAGTIVFVAEVGGWTATTSIEIAPARAHIEKARVAKNASMLEVEITGFDNTRSAGPMSFTFFTSNGEVVQPGTIRIDPAADFKRFFESSTLGGSFSVKAVFPVAGAIANIASAEIEITNNAGATKSGKTPMQ